MNVNKPYNRTDRVGNEILHILSAILIKHIDLSHLGFLSFTHVVVSPDLRLANIYYSVLNRKKSDSEINIEINKLRKAFKKYMGPELHLKSTPDLKFYHDESLIYSDKINQLLHKLDIKKNIDDSESV